jgi:hypothetical protein
MDACEPDWNPIRAIVLSVPFLNFPNAWPVALNCNVPPGWKIPRRIFRQAFRQCF